MAIRAVCAPGNELAASVELAVRGELADVEPHPYLAGMGGVYLFDDGRPLTSSTETSDGPADER